jgi:hypothetical protein
MYSTMWGYSLSRSSYLSSRIAVEVAAGVGNCVGVGVGVSKNTAADVDVGSNEETGVEVASGTKVDCGGKTVQAASNESVAGHIARPKCRENEKTLM